MWYLVPEENMELVKIIAITEAGCIVETLDGFAINIGIVKHNSVNILTLQ
jgi:hypothetical protein